MQKQDQQQRIVEKIDKRLEKGKAIALSRRVYRLNGKDVYYVESESEDSRFYFVGFEPREFEWCSCPDNSNRGNKCKHIHAIEYAIKNGKIEDIDKLPIGAKRDNSNEAWKNDDYDF